MDYYPADKLSKPTKWITGLGLQNRRLGSNIQLIKSIQVNAKFKTKVGHVSSPETAISLLRHGWRVLLFNNNN